MPQQVRVRRQKTIDYNANGRKVEELSRGMIYREIMLTLTGTVDCGSNLVASGGIQSNLDAAEEWGVVQRIDLIANGTDQLRSVSGEELFQFNQHWYGTPPRRTTAFGAAVDDTNVSFDSTLIMPLWMPQSIHPIDTALDSRKLSDLKMEVTWGDANDIVKSAVTGVNFATDPSIDVASLESFGIDTQFSQQRIFRLQESSVSVQSEFQVDLPVGHVYRSFLIHAQDANGDDLAGAIDNIKLRSSTNVFFDLQADVIQKWCNSRKGIQTPGYDAANAVTLPYATSTNYDQDSWYYIDLVTDGRLSEGIDTIGFAELKLEFDTNATISQLDILPVIVIPVRNANRR